MDLHQARSAQGLQGIDERNSLSGDKVTSVDYNPRKQATRFFSLGAYGS